MQKITYDKKRFDSLWIQYLSTFLVQQQSFKMAKFVLSK